MSTGVQIVPIRTDAITKNGAEYLGASEGAALSGRT
jgi:hypothetical protein